MKWISIIATLPLLCSHTGRLGTMTRGSQSHGWLCFLFFLLSTVYLFSSSLFPLQNQSHSHAVFFFHSHTQFELWVHSPLIHCQSYLSSGTIATVRAQLRTTARRKIALLPQGCGTLCSQPRQPSSLSLLHIKSSSWRVEKRFQFLRVWLPSKWSFYYCSVIDGAGKWLIASVLGVTLSVLWSTAHLCVCSVRSCAS